MKAAVNPAVAAAVIIAIVLVVGFLIYRGAAANPGSKAPGEVGNAGPFAPGSATAAKGAKPAEADPYHGRPGASPH